jgi:GABA(A) receptor-associated protein
MKTFKERIPFEKRKYEAGKIKDKYPDRVPVIVEKLKSSDIQEIDKNKYLVPKDLTVGQFIYIIRKRIKLNEDESMFLFFNENILAPNTSLIKEIYEEHKDLDNFLYGSYAKESVFGDRFL